MSVRCLCFVRYNDRQRAGIVDGGELEFRPPEPLPGFLIKLNIKNYSLALSAGLTLLRD